jgi:hypothetical protein
MAIDLNRNPTMRRIDNPHVVVILHAISNTEIRDMREWCTESKNAGFFLYYFDKSRQGMVFVFSHENVAFEFKMRWG